MRMRKKISETMLCMLFVLIVCVSVGQKEARAAGTCYNHDRNNVKTVKKATCTDTGKKEYYCSKCGKLIASETVAKTDHTWQDQSVISKATCTQNGAKLQKCSVCGTTRTKTIASTGHSYTGVIKRKDATCTEAGWEGVKCNNCGAVPVKNPISALGHNYEDQYYVETPTCTQAGGMLQKCSRCGDKRTDSRSALGHDYSGEKRRKEPGCTTDGYVETKCTRCGSYGNRKTLKATGHSTTGVKVHQDPTCAVDGYDGVKCNYCDVLLSKTVISATGKHKWTDQYYTKTPTCTQAGAMLQKCSVCGNKRTESRDPLNHDFDESKYEIVKEPTTTETGIGRCYCRNNGCTASKDITLPKKSDNGGSKTPENKNPEETVPVNPCRYGHTSNGLRDEVDSTCYSEGYYRFICTVCNKPFGEPTVIPKKAHKWDSGKLISSAEKDIYLYSCTNPGCTATYTAEKEKQTVPEKNDDDPCKNGHSSNGVPSKVAPTCTEDGYQVLRCTRCNAELGQRTVLPRTGHSWDEGTTVTKDADGEILKFTCTNKGCSETYTKRIDFDHSGTTNGSSNQKNGNDTTGKTDKKGCGDGNHIWGEWVEKTVATCMSGAYLERKCITAGCDAYEAMTTPVGTHLYRNVVVESTCTEYGYTCKECVFCGCTKSMKKDKTLKEHMCGEWICDQKESCYLIGKYHCSCSVCGQTQYRNVPKLEHVPKSKLKMVQEPTCTKNGYGYTVCKNCKNQYGDKITVPALGHTVKKWTAYTDKTTKKAMEKGTCTVCGQKVTRESTAAVNKTASDTPVTEKKASDTTVDKIITGVSNPSTGVITFKITAPANTTVDYTLELVPHKRMGSLDGTSGSVKNKSDSPITKKITVPVNYFSDQYTITATYTTGPARNRKYHNDSATVTSSLHETVYSSKFVWDEKNIKTYRAGQVVAVCIPFAVTGAVDIFVTKGALSEGYATLLSVTFFAGDVLDAAGSGTETRNIRYEPIKGWGYQIKLVPKSGGYTEYLLIYDEHGNLYDTIDIGSSSYSTVSLISH